jgi:hypothetical protein
MFTTYSSLLALAALPQAFATVFITSPTDSTTCHGGQPCQLAWSEDKANTPPLLADWGPTSVGIWVGSQQQQTQLQLIQDGVNVATTGSITFTPDPSIGPNDSVYFIRFTSDATKDPANPQFNVESFSHKFTLDNMSGQFNATVAAQIAGASSAPLSAPGPTSSAASPASSSAPSSSKPAGASSSAAKTSSSAKPSGSSPARPAAVVPLAGIAAPVAAVLALFL